MTFAEKHKEFVESLDTRENWFDAVMDLEGYDDAFTNQLDVHYNSEFIGFSDGSYLMWTGGIWKATK